MQNLRWIHRWATLLIVVFTLYLGATGTIIQMIDLKTVLNHAPATDPDLRAIRESYDGPPDYQVRETRDYLSQALPAGADYGLLLGKVLETARKDLAGKHVNYVELRMLGSRLSGVVGLDGGHVAYDPASGEVVERSEKDNPDIVPRNSTRNDFKHLHRMTTFGDWALAINIFVSVGLTALIVTGIWIYVKLLAARRKIKRPAFFWKGGGTWRELHRVISIVSAGLLLGVTLSGAWLAVESAGLAIYMAKHRPPAGAQRGQMPPRRPMGNGAMRPVDDGQVAPMAAATIKALAQTAPGDPVKVIRLRNYAGYAQGIVVTGGDNSQQLVFDTENGRSLSVTEPGYPEVPFPFGWHAHQLAKSVHRGDFLGLTGRWMDLLAGLAMIYLSVSGGVMYWEMWRKRAETGRKSVVWK